MERKEPTLSSSAGMSEAADSVPRRSQSHSTVPEDMPPPQRSRPSAQAAYVPTASNNLAAIALVIALAAVAGAGFLGWKLFQTESILNQADIRIQGLEQQLNLTSEESSASVVTLQANLKKMDSDVRKLIGDSEANRKALAASVEKITAVARDVAAAKKESSEAKAGLTSIKQEVAANKAVSDAAATKIDSAASSISQQNGIVQDLREQIAKLKLELADVENLAARTRANEEAISAIDDFRRSTNRDILQIKQQLNSAPK